MTQTDRKDEKKTVPPKGQGTVFVRPLLRILTLGRMNLLILLLPSVLAVSPPTLAVERSWLNDEIFEGMPFRHWPVWSRPGNDNILSRIRQGAEDVA